MRVITAYCKAWYKQVLFIICVFGLLSTTAVAASTGKNTNDTTAIDSLKILLKTPLNDSLRILVLHQLTKEFRAKDPITSLVYAEEALNIYKTHSPDFFLSGKTNILNFAGVAYQKTSDYPKALSCYLELLKVTEQSDKKDSIAYTTILNSIGICYMILKQPEKGKKYITEALDIALRYNLKDRLAHYYNNLGIIEKTENNLQQALFYFQKSIQYGDNIVPPLTNLGDAYFNLKRYGEAEYYLKKALTLSLTQDDIYNRIVAYISLGSLYTQTSRFKEAKANLFTAKDITESSGLRIVYEELYESIIHMYKQQKDYKNMSLYQSKLMTLKDSIYKETNTRQINEMQARYELDRKNKEIQLLNKDKQIIEAKMEKERNVSYFVIAVFVLMLLMGLIIARNIVLKQRIKNRISNEQRKLVEHRNVKLLNENISARYEVLKSKINPHFLFNSFTMLSSLIVKDPQTARHFVKRFSKLYRAMLETSSETLVTLAAEMEFVNNYLYLQKMCMGEYLIIKVNIDARLQHLSIPPFAIQMMVENAIKHNALPDEESLIIEIYTEEETIIISNNRYEKLEKMFSTAIGQKNIMERYTMIARNLEVEITQNKNRYTVRLPLIKTDMLVHELSDVII